MSFYRVERGNTSFFTIPSFSATGLVEHAFTSRHGGVSSDVYHSLNLAFHVGDDPVKVKANRENIVKIFGSSLDNLVAGEQVHGKTVHIVTTQDAGRGNSSMNTAIPQVDALITNVPGIMLSSYYADCVPLFFLDPQNKVIGLAHAGWKGTVQKIGVLTLQTMIRTFNTQPAKCLVGIGPSIGSCCYEVDNFIFDKFAQNFDYNQILFKSIAKGKWMLDLQKANMEQLIRVGVPQGNITQSGLCTSCNVNDFFSYRKEQGKTGRQASLIILKSVFEKEQKQTQEFQGSEGFEQRSVVIPT